MTPRSLPPHRDRRVLLAAVLLLVPALAGAAPDAPEPEGRLEDTSPRLALPPSRLDEPFDAPVLAGLFLAGGAGTAAGQKPLHAGYGGVLVLRPGEATRFLDFLGRWHAGLVLQVDRQELAAHEHLLSADGILRRYFADRGRGNTEVRLFAGLGLGATRFAVPGGDGAYVKDFSALAEVGQEWLVDGTWFVWLKGQYRVLLRPHAHHAAWSVQLGLGVPWPF